jgi:hypothetical protein
MASWFPLSAGILTGLMVSAPINLDKTSPEDARNSCAVVRDAVRIPEKYFAATPSSVSAWGELVPRSGTMTASLGLPTERIAATIVCTNDHDQNTCDMAMANFSCEGKKSDRPYLSAKEHYFLVTEWSADRIVARDYLNQLTQLIIHPKEKRVELLHYIVSFVGTQETTYEPVSSSYELK